MQNWFDAMNGNLEALNKYNLKFVPLFFGKVYLNMLFQMEYLDLSLLKKKADFIVLNSMASRTGNKGIRFKADTLKKEIENKGKESIEDKQITLNDFIDFIEITLDSIGVIDPTKISASRGYSLFNKAKARAELIKKRNKRNVNIRK